MLTYKDIQSLLGVSRQRVQRLARAYQWRSTRIGNVRIFDDSDVRSYQLARFAFRALQKLRLIRGKERPIFFPNQAPQNWRGEQVNPDWITPCPRCQEALSICLPDKSRGICPECGEWEKEQ